MPNLNWIKGGSSDGRPGYFLEFDYSPEIIQKLKETVPAHLKEWQPDNKRWWVHEYCEKPINDIFPGFIEAVHSQMKMF